MTKPVISKTPVGDWQIDWPDGLTFHTSSWTTALLTANTIQLHRRIAARILIEKGLERVPSGTDNTAVGIFQTLPPIWRTK